MLKYHSTYVGFREIPDEISLCINISNCPNKCKECHSPHLLKDVGEPLTYIELVRLIKANSGITCVCFMGGDREYWEVERLSKAIKDDFDIKIAWYSGNDDFHDCVDYTNFNYVKIGSYNSKYGPLNLNTTNQTMFKIDTSLGVCQFVDITNKFWR